MHVVSNLLSLAISLVVFGGAILASRTKTSKQGSANRQPHQKRSTIRNRLPLAAYWLGGILGGMTRITKKSAGGAAIVVSLIAGVIYLCWPMVSVTASGLFDENNPYSETFTVQNIAVLRSLMKVNVTIGICKIEYAPSAIGTRIITTDCPNDFTAARMGHPAWATPELAAGELFAVVLTSLLTIETPEYRAAHPNVILSGHTMAPFRAANIIVFVDYTPWLQKLAWGPWAWWVAEQYMPFRFRFIAEEQPNHKMMWRPVPLSWKDVRLPGR
jgi:hypothetical protein